MRFFSWLRDVVQRRKVEAAMDAELQFHIDSYTNDLISSGIPLAEAHRRARLEFGNLELKKEDCRASLGLRLWDELRADLTYAVRTLRQSPGFTAVAVISLAIGIGVNTAIFTLANEVLFKTISVPESDRLRLFNWVLHPKSKIGSAWGGFNRRKSGEQIGSPFPYPLYVNLRQHVTAMEDLVAFKDVYQLAAHVGSESEPVDAQLVSGNFYRVLNPELIAGRPISEADDSLAAPAVAVISDGYWSRRFGRSAEALGKVINVNFVPVTIIGVNSPEFNGAKSGAKPELFLPITLQPRLIPNPTGPLTAKPNMWWVLILGRLKPGVSSEAAQAITEADFHRSIQATIPGAKPVEFPGLFLDAGNRGFDVQTKMFVQPIQLLMGSAGLLLLIACVNLANLLLARGSARQREISIRLAMGAGRFRIFRQALTESMFLAGLGGCSGLALGYATRGLLPSLFEESWHSSPLDNQFDWRVFAFAAAITLLTGLVFGIAPALRLNVGTVQSVLKETTRMSSGSSRALFAKALIVVQVALSVLLLVGAGLFVRTLTNLKSVPIGFNPERLLLFQVNPPASRYKGGQRVALFQQIEQKLNAIPGVQMATLSSEPLLANSMESGCMRPSGRLVSRGKADNPWSNRVGSRFFETMQIPIVLGRAFNEHDNQTGPPVAIVNRRLAAQFFPNGSALGQTINVCDKETAGPAIEIVGIAADAKYTRINEDAPATLYLSYLQQEADYGFTFEVKTAAASQSIMKLVRAAVASVDRDLPLLDIHTQTQQIDASLSQQRTFATLTTSFGLMALLLAAIGIYGIMAYNVARRTGEIGIRMALGAQARGVLAMILREVWLLATVGIVLGIAGALATTKFLSAMLFGIKPNDPVTYGAAGLLLLLIALVAGALPAHRAARIDPVEALRHE